MVDHIQSIRLSEPKDRTGDLGDNLATLNCRARGPWLWTMLPST